MMMPDDFNRIRRCHVRDVAMVEKVPPAAREFFPGVTPATVVIAGERGNPNACSSQVTLGSRSTFGGVHDISQPDHFDWIVIAHELIETRFDFVIAPARQQVSSRA